MIGPDYLRAAGGVRGQLWTPLLSDDLPKPKTTELLQKGMKSVQEYSAAEEREESRRWRVFRIGEQEHRVDMKAIEPYKRVISHGGNATARKTLRCQ